MRFFPFSILFWKVVINFNIFFEDTKPIRKFIQKIQIFEHLHTIIVWTTDKIEWNRFGFDSIWAVSDKSVPTANVS